MDKREVCNERVMKKTSRDCRINETVIKEITEIPYRILKEQMDSGGVFPVRIPGMCSFTPRGKHHLISEYEKKQPPVLKKFIKEGKDNIKIRIMRIKKKNRGLL